MKTFVFQIIIIGILYLVLTLFYSILWGLPPFNHGIVIGYPAIFYQFYISEDSKQFGFMGVSNFLINFIIITTLTFLFNSFKRNITKTI